MKNYMNIKNAIILFLMSFTACENNDTAHQQRIDAFFEQKKMVDVIYRSRVRHNSCGPHTYSMKYDARNLNFEYISGTVCCDAATDLCSFDNTFKKKD